MVIIEQGLLHGLNPTAHRFRLNRKTVREWRDRFRAQGPDGLIPRYPDRKKPRIAPQVVPLVEHARRERSLSMTMRQSVSEFSVAPPC